MFRCGRRGLPLFQNLREYDQKDDGAQNRGEDVRGGLGIEHRLRAPENGQYDEAAEEYDEFARQRIIEILTNRKRVKFNEELKHEVYDDAVREGRIEYFYGDTLSVTENVKK